MLKVYFTDVMYLSIFIALAVGISHPRLRKSTSFGAGVLFICIILLPLVDIIRDIDVKINTEDYLENIDTGFTDDALETAFEEGIREYISSGYHVDKELVTVMADGFDLEYMRAERIYVTLCGKAATLDYKRIESVIEKEFTNEGKCEVSLRLG